MYRQQKEVKYNKSKWLNIITKYRFVLEFVERFLGF